MVPKEAQGPYRAAANELNKGRHGNYVDDWIGYSNSLVQLCDDFEQFLKVCEKYNITLGPHKTRFGFKEAQFFGFRVNAEGSHLALKHLDPIRQMVPPTDVHELRRVLGIFVVSRKYVKDFATITKPMTDVLRGKLPVFFWGESQQKALETNCFPEYISPHPTLTSPSISPLMLARMGREESFTSSLVFPFRTSTPTTRNDTPRKITR